MEITTADYLALIDGNGKLHNFKAVQTIAFEALAAENKNPAIDAKQILSAAIVAARGNSDALRAILDKAIAEQVAIDDQAVGVVIRSLSYTIDNVADLLEREKLLRKQLKRESLGLFAEAFIVSRTSEMSSKGSHVSSNVMLSKIEHLRKVVERAAQSDDTEGQQHGESDAVILDDEVSGKCFESLIKGYGSLNLPDEIKAVMDLVRRHPVHAKDSRFFEEAMRWYSFHGNAREVIRVKEEAAADGIHHTPNMFLSLFRVLGKTYLRQAEKYYAEMKARNITRVPNLYPVLLQLFDAIGNTDAVNELLVDIQANLDAANTSIMSPKLFGTLLRLPYLSDDEKTKLIKNVAKLGYLSMPNVQGQMVHYYSTCRSEAELDKFLAALPHKSSFVYSSLLGHYSAKRDQVKFLQTLNEIRRFGVIVGEKLFGTMIQGCSNFGDADRVKSILQEAKASDRLRHCHFFGHAAAAFANLEDIEGVNSVWGDLLASKVPIFMEVYNKFLNIYADFNHTDKVQEVLSVMMRNEPPNTVTATTVLDMLGKMGRIPEMESVLEEMNNSAEASPTVVTYHHAMNAYAKNGDVAKMEATRAAMREKGIADSAITFNILAEGYARAKRFEHLEELSRERSSKGIAMDKFGFTIMLNAYGRAKMEDKVNELVQQLLESGTELSPILLSAIGSAYSFVGDVAQAEHYVSLLMAHPRRTPRHVEGIFLMYARLRDTTKMEELLEKVEKTSVILNTCVTTFAKSGNFAKVSALLVEMEQRGFSLAPNTGLILSSLLVKAGKTELAQAVLQMKSVAGGTGNQTHPSRPRHIRHRR